MRVKMAPGEKQRVRAERIGKQWQYKTVGLSPGNREEQMNALGADGWEVITYIPGENLLYLKRPKAATAEATN
jgi:hypothetical protein